MDPLADAMSTIKNQERIRQREVTVKPASRLIGKVLEVMRKRGFIGDFKHIDNGKGGKFRVELLGNISSCGVIKPRFSFKCDEFEKWEKRYLPAAGFGVLAVTTSEGIMSHQEAKERGLGGKLLAFVY